MSAESAELVIIEYAKGSSNNKSRQENVEDFDVTKSNKNLDTTINKEIASKSSNADKDSVGDRRMMMKFLCNEAK